MRFGKAALVALAAIIGMSGGITSAHAAPPDYYPSEYSKLIEASKAESGVLVYGNIGEVNWRPILAKFKEEYPWIKVQFLDLASDEVFQRFYAEQSTGNSTVDIVLSTSASTWTEFMEKGNVVNYVSAESPKISKESNPAPGVYTISYDPYIIAYNKLLLNQSEWPKSLADLAALVKPDSGKFNKRLGVQEPMGTRASQAIYAHHIRFMGEDKDLEMFNILGPLSQAHRSAGPTYEKILTGEYLAGYNLSAIPLFPLLSDPNQAAIIGWTYPADGTVAAMRNLSLAKTMKNPNSAKLLLDFLLSKKGQEAVSAGGLMPFRGDIEVPAGPVQLSYTAMEKAVGKDKLVPTSLDPAMLTPPKDLIAKVRAAFKLPN